MGIPPGILACETLASRIIKKIDLGKINKYYFIDKAYLKSGNIEIDYGNFKIIPTTKESDIFFYNFSNNKMSNPVDGFLETVITPIKSTFFGKRKIKSSTLIYIPRLNPGYDVIFFLGIIKFSYSNIKKILNSRIISNLVNTN